jgi:dihydroxyacid dehydratase/phosphogluconate dehydratase
VPYDSVTDFIHLTQVHSGPNVLVAHPSAPFNTFKELVDYGRANPGKLTTATRPRPRATWRWNCPAQRALVRPRRPALASATAPRASMQMGYGPADWKGKPVIAIVNTWSDANQCHAHFKQRVEDVKRGVLQAGGFPLELPAISLSEPIVKPTTMLYRNFLAMETEELLRSHPVDGAVLMGGCDKTTPGLVMGACQHGPALHLPARRARCCAATGRARCSARAPTPSSTGTSAAPAASTPRRWLEIEAGIARSHGTCMTMGTAATMMGIAEAWASRCPARPASRRPTPTTVRMSAECGRRIVRDGVGRPDARAHAHARHFDNAHRRWPWRWAAPPTPSSTWWRCRAAPALPVTLDDFDAASRHVPVIANIRPSGDTYLMEDFYYAGGLPALMKRMAGRTCTCGALTVNGRTLGENIAGAEVYDDDVIRPLDNPIYAEGALAVLRGNLAPDGVVIKPSACAPHLLQHTGRALVFDDYPSLKKAVDDPDLDVTGRRHPGAAQRRPAGRPRHAGVGHAADPDQAGEAGRARHAAPERRAHERHQLRRLHAALRARGLHRRPAGAGAHRRPDHGGRAGPAHPPGGERRRAGAPPRRLGAAAAALRARLRLDVRRHILQADQGCDFDFLETGFGARCPSPTSSETPHHDIARPMNPCTRRNC